MSTEEDKIRERGLKDLSALDAARGLIPLLPDELESKDVSKMHKDYLTNIVAGLVDDSRKLQAENERLRKAAELMDKVEAEWDRMQRSESGGCDIMYAVFNWRRYKEGRDAK